MGKVQWMPWWWAASGGAALAALGVVWPLAPAGWVAGAGYLVISAGLLSRGLRETRSSRFGPANAVTATRSVLVGLVTAIVVGSLWAPAPTLLLVALAACALILDGVDGSVARRTGSQSELGARFDMEVDAFLLLMLSLYDVRFVGWWVLSIGLMRYAFVVAGSVLPWMRRTLPPRYWRKVVTAACGIALTVVAAEVLPAAADLLVAGAALLLLVESFGRDVIWLARMNRADARLVSLKKASSSPQEESR
ncbi:CDP-alcohol phosphatidyltransferase family protein [Microbacterium timonense]|uniref:CDP-alcohol phosphatidyltransferase family protein n=1 Tax=Microbacterium timonense TaxID=2086576 RepID=UPI000D1008B9|nr:CDP-alcohol phosphatidyltransferase family protein [Microbacterium timonense]